MEKRNCLNCGTSIQGRADKKFCDDQCRNTYNYQLYADSSNLVRRITNRIKKNRTILESLIPEGEEMGKISKNRLLLQGYDFKYETHRYETKKGATYHFCYDYGYLSLDGEWVLVVRSKEK